MTMKQRPRSSWLFLRQALPLMTLHLIICIICISIICCSEAIYLDIHVPLLLLDDSSNNGSECLLSETLHANELLRSYSIIANGTDALPLPPVREQIDLFTKHTPHITLFLADFALEMDKNGTDDESNFFHDPSAAIVADDNTQKQHQQKTEWIPQDLNATKVNSFLNKISSINFTNIIHDWDECTLSLTTQSFLQDKDNNNNSNNNRKYYTINGAYTMLNIHKTSCLQTLSNTIVQSVQSFIKHPIICPSWIGSLPEPQRSMAIYNCREYGSPNVFERFAPHLTVGFDIGSDYDNDNNMKWREDAMDRWNEGFASVDDSSNNGDDGCTANIEGIAVGVNSVGGTVLANSRLKYWRLAGRGVSNNFVDNGVPQELSE